MIRDIRVGALILFVQRIHQLIVWIDLHYTLQAESVTVHRIFPSFKGTLNQDFDWDSKALQYTHKWCSNILWEETSIFLHLTNNMRGWRSFSIHVIMWPVSWSINQAMRVPSPNSGPDEVVQRLSRLYGAAGLWNFEWAETLEVSMFIFWGMRWPSKQDNCSTCRHCRKRSGFKDVCFDPFLMVKWRCP